MSQNLHFQIQRKKAGCYSLQGGQRTPVFMTLGPNHALKWFYANARLRVQLSGAGVGSCMSYALPLGYIKHITVLINLNNLRKIRTTMSKIMMRFIKTKRNIYPGDTQNGHSRHAVRTNN